ncbi:arylsulfotransferase family protein [Halomicrococcus sp. SG-WS-1]|uniref:arylsulfotransferase family protein n=1 Tax=Halomicrococcus sp. SG-WS-1 TaxID=3439057 RepID=UPI003F7A7D04
MRPPSRRQLFAAVAAVLCVLSLPAVPLAAGGANGDARLNPCVGTMTSPANGTTVIAVQGFTWHEGDAGKKPAKLVGVGPRGQVQWVHHAADHGTVWQYDVDPMANGNVFVTATKNKRTYVYEFDPRTQEHVWQEELPIEDTHDVDLINGGTQLLVANMKNYDEDSGKNDDSIFVYDLQKDEIVWRWYFRDHYPKDTAENYTDDWTHVNDVDKIADGKYLASPRNFDQAIVVDRSTNEVTMRLGSDDDYDVLDEQHNPDYLESENGSATFLVADSNNGRIVEYARRDDGWERTWKLGKGDDLSWPRDADRLPNGNTLVGDSRNHRVLEVAPNGTVVWEFSSPYLVYDAARMQAGEHGGPTIADMNATGAYGLQGDAARHENWSNLVGCHSYLQSVDGWAAGQKPSTTGATTEESGVNDDDVRNALVTTTTDDDTATSLPGFGVVVAAGALLAVAALLVRRRE